jgi:two-component sensor histidine kinase
VLQITPTQQGTPRWMGAFMSLHTWPYRMHVALLVALYVGTAKLGLSLHAVGGFATAVWPPTGLALVNATVGVTSGWLGGVIATDVYYEAWRTWWLGDMNGDLVVGALLLTWSTRPKTIVSSRLFLEGAGLLLTVVTLGLLVFTRSMATDIIDFSYLIFPVLIWAALRFGPPGASAATAVASSLFNPQAVKFWGRAPKLHDPVDGFCGSCKLFATDGTPIAHDTCWMALTLRMNQEYNGHEIIIKRPDGQRLTALAYTNPVHDEAGTLLGAVNVLVDITKRKQAEAQLQASLHEKEILLKTIHHRVKNNLQVIAGILYLQSDHLKDHEDVALFEDTQNPVKSMALVHESLSRTGDLAHFNFAHYIESLTTHLFQSHVAEVSRIGLDMELDEIAFDVDTAIPCSLILNEFLTNALKYAFPDGRSGNIHITLRAAAEQATLSVRDTGIGFPEGFDFHNTESLGLQLVGMMTEQLRGDADTHTWGWHHVYRQYSLWRAIGEGGRACPRPRF